MDGAPPLLSNDSEDLGYGYQDTVSHMSGLINIGQIDRDWAV